MLKKCKIMVMTLLLVAFSATNVMAAGSEYIVKSGDSLWQIAQNNGTTVNQLKQINGLTSDLIKIGEKLLLATSATITPVVSVSNTTVPTVAVNTASVPTVAAGSTVYVVQAGDSLWQISVRTGVSVDKLKELNGLSSNLILVGQKLNLGTSSAAVPSRSGDSTDGSKVVAKAAEYLGSPYVYGGQSPSGFDCSGFVYYIFKQFGYNLPRTAASQAEIGLPVDKDNLRAGDVVFFAWGGGSYINHVGIVCGNGQQFIHSSSPSSGGVIYSSLNSGSYAKYYVCARRILR